MKRAYLGFGDLRETHSFSPTHAPQHPGIASDRVRIIGIAGAVPQAGGGGLRMISEEEVFASFLVDRNESPLRACDALAEIDLFPDIPWEDLRMDSGDANRRVSSKSEEMAKYVPGTSVRDFFWECLGGSTAELALVRSSYHGPHSRLQC